MTRVRISICLLMLMTAISIFSGLWVDRRCVLLAERARTVCSAFENGGDAVCEAERLEREWEDMRIKASFLLKYDKLSEMDRIVSRADVITAEHSDEILPQMAELIRMLDILRKSEIPYFYSVF